MMSNGERLLKEYKKYVNSDCQYQGYYKFLNKCNQSDLREAFADDKSELLMIIFVYDCNIKRYSEDFFKQMFSNLSKKEKRDIEEWLDQTIYYVADDVYTKNKETLNIFADHIDFLINIKYYILYADPISYRIKKEYDFIINEVEYYLERN